MLCVDVNVLVYAHRAESPAHDEYRDWLEAARVAPEPLGLADLVLSGFLRVVTHPRVFRDPTPLGLAVDFVEDLRDSDAVVTLAPGERHWGIFLDLCQRAEAKGNLVPDAFLAGLAVEQGATLVTADRGFARFPGLKVVHPVAR